MSRQTKAKRRQRVQVQNSGEQIPLTAITPGSEYYDWLTGGLKSAGMSVNERTAMCVAAVWACVQLISGAIGSLPVAVYRRKGISGDREQIDDPLWWLLNEEPLPLLSSCTFWEYILISKLLHGDGFARILRDGKYSNKIVGFEPLHPLSVFPMRVGNRLAYYLPGLDDVIDQDDMLHFTGLGFNASASSGTNATIIPRSLSPLRHALKSAAGIALAADKFSGDFFGEGSKPEFLITTNAAKLGPEQKATIQEAWKDMIGGNRFKPGVLGAGMDVKELTISAEDSQLMAARQFQVEDVARIFGVPPFMIGHTQNTTSFGSGVEQMGIGFVKYTLMRHLVGIRQELNRKCFRDPDVFCEHVTTELERGDIKTRFEAYRIAVGRAGEPGWMTPNQVRKMENQPPLAGGDTLNTGTQNAPAPSASGS